jgi:hypothetical protein
MYGRMAYAHAYLFLKARLLLYESSKAFEEKPACFLKLQAGF